VQAKVRGGSPGGRSETKGGMLNKEYTKTLFNSCTRSSAAVSTTATDCVSDIVSDELLQKLYVIQNAAARVETGVMKFDHITPVLRELHFRQPTH